MKFLPLLFLFTCLGVKGQHKNIITGLNAGYDIHIGIWTGQLSIPWGCNTPQDTSGNILYGMNAIHEATTGNSGARLGISIDTPQADRNPNDFYVDTLGDTSYVMNTPHGRISSKDLSLEEKLLQYAAECWNDSTVKYNHFEFYWKESLPSQNNSSGRANTFIGQVAGSVITNCIQKPGIYPAGHRDCYCNTSYEECTREKYPHHYTKKTTHREPTFKGFIEYLKKK